MKANTGFSNDAQPREPMTPNVGLLVFRRSAAKIEEEGCGSTAVG
jgi:hypothetical protein